MEGEHALFSAGTAGSLFVMAAGAFVIPLICRPLRLPAAVGEILFGVVVGPPLLGWVQVTEFIQLLAHLGFFLLMFIAGLELDFGQIEKGGIKVLVRGALTTALVFAFSFGAASAAGYSWFVGMVVGAVSIGIPLVLLHETGLGKLPFGQYLLLVGSVGEFASILLATGVSAYSSAGGINGRFLFELMELSVVFVLAYVVLVILRTAVWWRPGSFARVFSSHDPAEIGVRAGLALMFIFVAVAAYLHIDPILGAFLAGALFSFVFRAKGPLEVKFMSIGNGFFVPFFFISVGLEFNLEGAKNGDFLLLLKLLLALVLVRLLAFALTRPPELTSWHAVGGALLLSAPLTLLVVIGNLGLQLRLIDANFHATVILLAVISSTIYPFIFKLVVPRLGPPPKEEGHH